MKKKLKKLNSFSNLQYGRKGRRTKKQITIENIKKREMNQKRPNKK